MNGKTTQQKYNILFENGMLREEDNYDLKRIEDRWTIFTNIKQKTATEVIKERLEANNL